MGQRCAWHGRHWLDQEGEGRRQCGHAMLCSGAMCNMGVGRDSMGGGWSVQLESSGKGCWAAPAAPRLPHQLARACSVQVNARLPASAIRVGRPWRSKHTRGLC